MQIKNQVCSPEQAEKLGFLIGCGLETQYYWFYNDLGKSKPCTLLLKDQADDELKVEHGFSCWLFPAYTAAELSVLCRYIVQTMDHMKFPNTKQKLKPDVLP